MKTMTDVDTYIESAPGAAQPHLRELRTIVHANAPGVVEKISYGMPTYELSGRRLLHIAAAKSHVGVYALVHVDGEVPAGLSTYLDHRSTLQFPFDQPLPELELAAAVRRKAELLQARA
jgi:uncharacterized protein YdhG (YjbR/CyaY superfamily)